jgi:hypothetical protein
MSKRPTSATPPPPWGSPEGERAIASLDEAARRALAALMVQQRETERSLLGRGEPLSMEAALEIARRQETMEPQPWPQDSDWALPDGSRADALFEGRRAPAALPRKKAARGWEPSERVGLVDALEALREKDPGLCSKMLAGVDWSEEIHAERAQALGGVSRERHSLIGELAASGSDELAEMAFAAQPRLWAQRGLSEPLRHAAALFARSGKPKALARLLEIGAQWRDSPTMPFDNETSPLMALAAARWLSPALQAQGLAALAHAWRRAMAERPRETKERAGFVGAAWRASRGDKKIPKTPEFWGLALHERQAGQALARAIEAGNTAFVALFAATGVPQTLLEGPLACGREARTLADVAFESRSAWTLDWLGREGVDWAAARQEDWGELWSRRWANWADEAEKARARGWEAMLDPEGSQRHGLWAFESWRDKIAEGKALLRMAPYARQAGFRLRVNPQHEELHGAFEAALLREAAAEAQSKAKADLAAGPGPEAAPRRGSRL